jgi:hypothetical protein
MTHVTVNDLVKSSKARSHGPYIPGHIHISEDISVDSRIDEYIPGDMGSILGDALV